MKLARCALVGLAVVLVGVLALAWPQPAAAAQLDSPDEPIWSIPGVFSLSIGEGVTLEDGTLKLDSSTVDLLTLNASTTIDGLEVDLGTRTYGWDNITVVQNEARGNEAVTVSNLQANIQGPASGYSIDGSARVDVHPNEMVQAGADITVSYNGLDGSTDIGIADGSASLVAGPVTLEVDGLNAGGGTLAVDSALVAIPTIGASARLDGYAVADGTSSWQELALLVDQLKLGDVAVLSDVQLSVPGPGERETTPVAASVDFELNAGDVAKAGGQLVASYDLSTGQSSLALHNASAVVRVSGWNLAVLGVNADDAGTSADSIIVSAEPWGLQAQVEDVTIDDSKGLSFGRAKVSYQPASGADGQEPGGFEMTIEPTDAGYVVTTTTLVPVATAR